MGINTEQAQPGQDRPLYVWHETGERYPWPQLLRLWGSEIASLQPGAAGVFLCNLLQQLADEATTWNLAIPAQHARYQADAEAYLAALERDARWDPGPEPDACDDATGSLDGHPSQDEGPRQYWFGDIGLDDTYMN
jgi:hypothetical protein